MARTLIGINTLTAVDQMVYANHMQFAFRLGRNSPGDDFILFTPPRMTIDMMRNHAAKAALENECDYLMFIDDDVLVSVRPTAYEMLKSHDKDVIAGWTIIRGYPFENMLFKSDGAQGLIKYNDFEQTTGLLEVDAVGFSCVLIKTSVLKKMKPPYFITGAYNTEDIYFCIKARKAIPDLKIWADLDCKTAHKLASNFIDPLNKKAWKTLEEDQDPSLVKPKNQDRGEEYLTRIEGVLHEA
jgi:hypothetical protein